MSKISVGPDIIHASVGGGDRKIRMGAVVNGVYRYTLSRDWEKSGPRVCWVMLNPSTADAFTDDATIRRVMGFSKREGFAGLEVVNLFAYRSTNPAALRPSLEDVPDQEAWKYEVVGTQNDMWIKTAMHNCEEVIVAWGSIHKTHYERASFVLGFIKDNFGEIPKCLGRSAGGFPQHPLRLPKTEPLIPYRPFLGTYAA